MDNLARVDTVQNSGMDVWSVSRLNQTISNVLQSESLLQGIWLEGEIYNLTYHNSGHIYFSLKDDRCNVSCTFFRGANQKLKGLKLQVGMQIMAFGGVSVYQPRGTYQFNVQRVTLAGEGELREAPLFLIGAPFQIKVWEALMTIPSGHVTTYSEIAGAIGAPKAVRAVGTAVGRNPVSWLIPCHRALRKSGGLGGYHWGLPVKRAMLAWEAARADA